MENPPNPLETRNCGPQCRLRRGNSRNNVDRSGTMWNRWISGPKTVNNQVSPQKRAHPAVGYFTVDRFLGDLTFNVFNSSAADGGGGTALSKTMADAVTSLP